MLFKKKNLGAADGSGMTASSTAEQSTRNGADLSREAMSGNSGGNGTGEPETRKPLFKKKEFPAIAAGNNQTQEQPAETAPEQVAEHDEHYFDDSEDLMDETSAEAEQEEQEQSTPGDDGGSQERFAMTIIEPSVATPIGSDSSETNNPSREVPVSRFFPGASPLPEPYFHNVRGDLCMWNDKGDMIPITEGTPFAAKALLRSNGGEDWGLETCHKDSDGRQHTTVFAMSTIVTGKKATIIGSLADKGLNVLPDMAGDLMDCIRRYKPAKRVIRTREGGWLDEEFRVYSLPHQIIGDTGGEEVVFQQENNAPTTGSLKASGTLEEWQVGIADSVKAHILPMFIVMAAFLGPLLRILRLDGGGWHFFGPSSRGKSTLLQIGASVWGKGSDPGRDAKSLVQRWHLTGNALEAIARCHNDMATFLDELGVFVGDLGQAIYLFSGGVGKAAMDSHRRLMQQRSWIGCVFSSGEKTIVDAISEAGRQVKGGQLVRMIDVPSADVFGGSDSTETATLVNSIKQTCATVFGTAGPAFVARLIREIRRDPDLLDNLRGDHERTVKAITPERILPEQGRMIYKFAAVDVVGRLAARFGVVPYSDKEIRDCILQVMDLCMDSGKGVSDTQRALWRLQEFLVRNHASLPSVSDPLAKASNAKAFSGRDAYLFSDEQLASAAGIGQSGIVEFAKALDGKGLLAKNEVGRLKSKVKVASAGGKHLRFYAVKARILEMEFGSDDDVTARITSPTEMEAAQTIDTEAADEAVSDSEAASQHDEDNLGRDDDLDDDEDEENLHADSFEGTRHEAPSIFKNRKRLGPIPSNNREPELANDFSGVTDSEEDMIFEDV